VEINEMKKTVSAIGVFVLLLGGSLAFAQMSGGMQKDQSGTMHHDKMGEHHDMMEHDQMMGGMMGMSNQMSATMGSGKSTAAEMKKMQDRMTEIQKEMSGMEMHK
jgi:hypothetical protein